VESLWGNVKGEELANLCADDLGEVAEAVRNGMARVGGVLSVAVRGAVQRPLGAA
jgi:hypothetical protein